MNATGDREKFQIACDWRSNRARVALIGSNGTEVLVAFPVDELALIDSDEAMLKISEEGESRLRAALLSMIGSNWPK